MDSKTLLSVMLVAVVSALAGAGIYAIFYDTETSSGNVFTAGTLDLKVNNGDDPLPVFFNVNNVKPGDSGSVSITLSNAGSIAGKAYIHFKNVVDRGGETPESEPKPDNGELSQYLKIRVSNGTHIVVEDFLSNIKSNYYLLGTIGGGGTLTVTIEWNIPYNAGNEIMGDSVTFDIEFKLEQA